MDICASTSLDSMEGKANKGVTSGHFNPNAGTNNSDDETEWVLSMAFFSSISEFIIRCSALGSNSSAQVKARLVEAFFFASFVICVILSAALPEMYR